jgi:hypothetical protein
VTNVATSDRLWQPLAPRSFLLILAVLAITFTSLDIAWHGPLTWAATQRFVVVPAEREWGFHAEPKDYGSAGKSSSLLTVIRVTPGGPFDRAGIKPGFAFAPWHNSRSAAHFGGHYYVFSGQPAQVRIRMLEAPDEPWRETTYDIHR